jgi:hypothetical protein
MARLSRKLRVCKWLGTIGCVLIALAVAGSWWRGAVAVVTCEYRFESRLECGVVSFEQQPWGGSSLEGELRTYPIPIAAIVESEHFPRAWLSVLPNIHETYTLGARGYYVVVPLWLPFLLLLVPTVLLWQRDRRTRRPGHCRRCDYDLTGNTTGRCPECGLEIAKPNGLSEAGRAG